MTHPNFLTGQPCDCGFDWSVRNTPRISATTIHEAGKLHDFLMNPKSRPDLQTPKAQAFLRRLERFHNEKTDPLMPWLAREWKKGRLADPWFEDTLDAHPVIRALPDETKGLLAAHHEGRPYEPDPGVDIPALYQAMENRDHPMFHQVPAARPGETAKVRLHQAVLDHWGDFLQSQHPLRRQLGDIMQQDLPSLHQRVRDWDAAMLAEARDQALKGGEVVHTTPDNWTVRRLTTSEELKAEGQAMGHCVGGYHPSVESGRSLIYSLRDPENRPHVTTEINPERFEEVDPAEWLPKAIESNLVTRSLPQEYKDMLLNYRPNVTPDWTRDTAGGKVNLQALYRELAKEYEPCRPLPHGGMVNQIQGKGNREPVDEYKARMADWFRTFPPEERPVGSEAEEPYLWDDEGYTHSRLDHPDLIPRHEEEFGGLVVPPGVKEDEYGLLHQSGGSMPADYDDLLDNIKFHDYGSQGSAPDTDHIDDIYRLAKERGEIPDLAKALEGYQEKQDNNFHEWMDLNWEWAPRYPDEPTGWEDEDENEVDEGDEGARPYWRMRGGDDPYNEKYYDAAEAEKAYNEEYADWERQHAGMSAVNRMYNNLQPHFGTHPETGEQGYWNELPLPEQPQQPEQLPPTTSKAKNTHPHFTMGHPCSCSFGRLAKKRLSKTAGKLEWLIERQDKFSQTPEGQRALGYLKGQVERNPAIDALAPWIYREAKKGHITIGDRTFYVNGGDQGGLEQITPPQLDHWADWFNSKSPTRRGVDIMTMPASGVMDRVQQWNEEMKQKMEEARAKEGAGQIVHRFDSPNQGWTVRRLRDEAEARDEGNQMGHCVGSYGRQIENGSSQIFSLRDPRNEPHATMEISPDNPGANLADYVIPEHVWDEVPHHQGVPSTRLQELHEADLNRTNRWRDWDGNDDRTDPEQEALDDFRQTYGHVPLEGGKVVQTQGKSNDTPNHEYTEMLDDWLGPHNLQSYTPWWDDYYTREGPEDFHGLLGRAGEHGDNVFGYRYPADNYYQNEPDDYRSAQIDAEEHGVDEPDLYETDPNYEKILASLIDPKGGWDTTPRDTPPWTGYNPEAGRYVYDYAAQPDHYVVSQYDGVPQFRPGEEEGEGPDWQRYQKSDHLGALREALESHMGDFNVAGWPGDERDYDHIVNPFERQEAINKDKREWFDQEYAADKPWYDMFNHLGPLLIPGYETFGTPPPSAPHPEQQKLFQQPHPLSIYPDSVAYPDYQQPSDELTYSKVAHTPLYYRWVFSPQTGRVELASNSEGHPLDVRYHSDLARELNEPNLTHGYAVRFGGGWRIRDWNDDPIEDQYTIASVMRALNGQEASRTASEALWSPVLDGWDRCHHGLPT